MQVFLIYSTVITTLVYKSDSGYAFNHKK